MNPAILMLLITNNYRGGIASLDEPDDFGEYDYSSDGMDWFLWGVLIILGLALAFAAYVTFKR